MKNIRRTLFLIFLSLVCSCTNEFDEFSNVTAEDPMMVTAILPDWDLEDVETRTSITTGAYPTAPSPVWVAGDSIGIYPNAGGDQLSFRINEGGSKTCTFDGGGWAMTSASYTAYSPFKRSYYYEQKAALPISMLGQTQNGNDNADHLGAYDIQIATGEKPETGSLIFSFSRKVALVRLEITAPKVATWTSVSLESDALFTTNAIMNLDLETPAVTPVTTSNSVTLNLKNVSTTRDNLSIIAYMMLLPVDLTGKTLSVKLTDNEGNIYSKEASITNNKTNFAANAARWVTVDFEEIIPNNEIWYTSTDGSIITPTITEGFGAIIVSNTYSNGKGIIVFKDNVTSIGKYAFYQCRKLMSIILPETVTIIDDKAFSECANLNDIKIPKSVNSIGQLAFYATDITNISIPNSVVSIGMDAFTGCYSLISITIPNSVTTIVSPIFADCPSLNSITVEESNPKYDSRNNCNSIIETCTNELVQGCISSIIPNSVTTIGYAAFANTKSITNITIPGNVSIIEPYAFNGCTSLTTVEIKSITPPEIFANTFFNCNSNITFYVPSASYTIYKETNFWKDLNIVEEPIPNNQIWYTSSDGNIVTPLENNFGAAITSNVYENGKGIISFDNNVTKIGTSAFESCMTLVNIMIPNSVSHLGTSAFEDCTSLVAIDIPEISTIYEYTFKGCTALVSVTIPNTVTEIKDDAFFNCKSLKNITLPNSLITIGGFKGCEFSEITIPESVKIIGPHTFDNCKNLSKISIPEGVTTIGASSFYGCTGLKTLIIPNNVTGVEDQAFYGCSGLTSIIIGDNVRYIGFNAFRGCTGVSTLTLPSKIETIGNSAFADMQLTSVTCLDDYPPSQGDPFWSGENTNKIDILYVPLGAKDNYSSNSNWNIYFKSIIELNN